jgi:hypothetical protein
VAANTTSRPEFSHHRCTRRVKIALRPGQRD